EGYRVFLDVRTEEDAESTIPLESGAEGELSDGIEDEGVYLPYAETVSGEDGFYRFENVPAVDENGDAYVYRIRMEKPDRAYYVPLYAADSDADNDYAHIN